MRGEIDKIPDSIVENAKKTTSSRNESLNKMAFTSGFFFILAQFCVRGLTFVVTPFYSRMLSKAQYGDIRVYESWLLIAYTVMSLCLWRSEDVAKYDFRDKYYEYTSSVHTLSYLAIAGFFGLALIFKEPFQRFTSMDDLMFYMCFLYVFTYTSMLYLQRRDKQMLRYKFSTLATLLTIVPGTVLSLWLIYRGRQMGLLDSLVHRRIIGYYVPQIIGGAIIAVVIWLQGKKFFDLTYWKYGLKYSLPLIPEALSIQIMNQSDKIMIQKLIGSDPTGVFSLATTISFIIWILEDSVWNAWIPWLYEKISRDETEDIAKPWTTVMHIFGLISWALVVLAPEEILILGGKKYYAAIIKSSGENRLLVAVGDIATYEETGAVSTSQWVKTVTGYHYAYYFPRTMETAYVDLASSIYEGEQKATLTAVSATDGAQLVYTTDGQEPTASSTKVNSGTQITLPIGTKTLKVGLLIGGKVSGIVTRNYTIKEKAITEVIIPSFCRRWTRSISCRRIPNRPSAASCLFLLLPRLLWPASFSV